MAPVLCSYCRNEIDNPLTDDGEHGHKGTKPIVTVAMNNPGWCACCRQRIAKKEVLTFCGVKRLKYYVAEGTLDEAYEALKD